MIKGALNIVSGITFVVVLVAVFCVGFITASPTITVAVLIPGLILALSPRMVLEWEQGVLLRIGKYRQTLKPGISWIIPGIDAIVSLVDLRIRTTAFSAEKALTKDTVPVNVDAVLFWVVTDATRAILEVERYQETIGWVAQTTLRDVIGRSELGKMISDRESLDVELQKIIDEKISEWGITIQSVEIRDVNIPQSLEDAMSRMAQADREKLARVILSQSEFEVAKEMEKAAKIYESVPISLQLRTMNMTYESIREKGALMVIPSSMAESLSGRAMGMAAATAGFKFMEEKEG